MTADSSSPISIMRPDASTSRAGDASRVATVYAVIAVVWVVVSVMGMAVAMGSTPAEWWGDLVNGLLFTLASSGLIYLLMRRGNEREQSIQSHLAASQERLDMAAARFPFAFAIYDPQLRLRYLNPRGLQWAGKPLEQVLGKPDDEVFPAELV